MLKINNINYAKKKESLVILNIHYKQDVIHLLKAEGYLHLYFMHFICTIR